MDAPAGQLVGVHGGLGPGGRPSRAGGGQYRRLCGELRVPDGFRRHRGPWRAIFSNDSVAGRGGCGTRPRQAQPPEDVYRGTRRAGTLYRGGRDHTFTGQTTLFPDITASPAPGHTPGHSFYELESEGRRLLVIGDSIHAAEVQLADSSVTVDYDVDPAVAAAQRKAVLAQLAKSHELAAGDHLSFPGLGHVLRSGSGFAFVPLPYDASVADVGQ